MRTLPGKGKWARALIEGIRTWWCFTAPWHHAISTVQLSKSVERVRCRCGRLYAINHAFQAVLSWNDELAELYNYHVR